MKKILALLLIITLSISVNAQDTVRVKNQVFEILYSQKLEQPVWIKYKSTNRPTNVNRGSMDFYKEPNIKTSDEDDYRSNVYDKGHGAPAATFSDNMENLKQTFSYLNSILQNQYLNRGEWRLLEEQIRKWDDAESITVIIDLIFDNQAKRVETNAAIPSVLKKHIYFEKQKKWRCFSFPNERPLVEWEKSEIKCSDKKMHSK
jgi:DNA/RNA endonuclease G (NUC1)